VNAAAKLLAAAVLGVAAPVVLPALAQTAAPLQLEGPVSPQPWQRYGDWNKARWDGFNTMANLSLTPPRGQEIEIKEIAGDAVNGQKLAFDRSRGGGCLACHVMGPKTLETPGNVGPDLSEIANVGRSDQWFYNYVFDPRVYNATSMMPPWGKHGFYSDAEIRDIVSFLKTLKVPAKIANPIDDPERRAKPVENRDASDPFVNPAMDRVDAGAALFKKPGPNGQACIGCHADPKAAFAHWAAEMPKWEPRLKKVLGAEEFIARHAKATTGAEALMETQPNIDLSIYLHNLANGAAIKVDLSSADAQAAYERGVKLAQAKVGQFNFACTDCHGQGANKWIRGQWLGEPKGQFDHFPLWRTSRNENWDIRKRFQWCNVQVRANELPPDAVEYGELELYLRKANEGLTLSAPNIRH
jgi:sulfur-oxidizing protein SoxA